MPVCAARGILAEQPTISNFCLPVPDTDLRAFLDEVAERARFAPEIITVIEADLDAHAREKKKLRLADRKFDESQTADFPELDIEDGDLRSDDLALAVTSTREESIGGVEDRVQRLLESAANRHACAQPTGASDAGERANEPRQAA